MNEKASGVMRVGQHDIGTILAPRERAQPMRGFDPEYADIVDYIIRCTHRIWEEKAVGLIYSHYSHNSIVHTPSGTSYGRDAVVAGTLQTLLAFPDRRLYGDAVVWSGDDATGFYTSHRITNTGTNKGPTAWGAATGRRCAWRGIADCVVLENRICEEWLVRDDMYLCRQLGFDPDAVARKLAEGDAARGAANPLSGDSFRTLGQFAPETLPRPDGTDTEAALVWLLGEIWNARRLDRVREMYARNAVVHAPCGRVHHGPGEIVSEPLALLAALPDATMLIEHIASRCAGGFKVRISVRACSARRANRASRYLVSRIFAARKRESSRNGPCSTNYPCGGKSSCKPADDISTVPRVSRQQRGGAVRTAAIKPASRSPPPGRRDA
jgi:hypothetical protein